MGEQKEIYNCKVLVKPGTTYVLVARFAMFGFFFGGGALFWVFLPAHSSLLFEIIIFFFYVGKTDISETVSCSLFPVAN